MPLEKSIEAIAYTLPELATAVGLSVDSIRKAIDNDELVASYFGTKPIVEADEARRWIKSLPTERPVKA